MKIWHHELANFVHFSVIFTSEVLELPHFGLYRLSQNMELLPFVRMFRSKCFEIFVSIFFGDLLRLWAYLGDFARSWWFRTFRLFVKILRLFRRSIFRLLGLLGILISIFIDLVTLVISTRIFIIFDLVRQELPIFYVLVDLGDGILDLNSDELDEGKGGLHVWWFNFTELWIRFCKMFDEARNPFCRTLECFSLKSKCRKIIIGIILYYFFLLIIWLLLKPFWDTNLRFCLYHLI